MENFFDIATNEEVAHHFPSALKNSAYFSLLREGFEEDADRNAGYLASLYFCRNNEEKTQYYLSQIKDEVVRMEFSITLYEIFE